MGKSIVYGLGIAGIFYLAVLYESRGLLAVCGTAVLLPFFFLCVLSYARQRLEYEILSSDVDFICSETDQVEEYLTGIRVKNHSGITLPSVRAKIRLKHVATGKTRLVKVQGKVPAEGMAEIMIKIREPEFGLWQAECKGLRCYEWMNFLYLQKKQQIQKQIMVFPAVYEITIKIGIRTRLFWSDGQHYHPQISGDDPSETLKLREYQKGDRLNRIHWKLSAKNEAMIVAEMSMPMNCNVVCFLDVSLSALSSRESRAYWEVLHTISQELLLQECAHYLVWRQKEEPQLQRKPIRRQEDLFDFWNQISSCGIEKGACPQDYAKDFPGEAYASFLVWNQALELFCNGKKEAKIKPEQARSQMLELELLL